MTYYRVLCYDALCVSTYGYRGGEEVKLEVFGSVPRAEEEVIRIRVKQDKDEIDMITVDEMGNQLDLLATISENGIYLYDLDGDYGFACDDNGCLRVTTD